MQYSKVHKVAVIGLGYVGLPLASICAAAGYIVQGYDTNHKITESLQSGQCSLQDYNVEKLFNKGMKSGGLSFSSDLESIKDCSIYLVCVPTPINKNKDPDLNPLISAIEAISPFFIKDNLIVIESTVFPGTCNDIVRPVIEKVSGLSCLDDIFLAHCPERVNPGDKFWTSANIPRVIGAITEESVKYGAEFYSSVLGGPVFDVTEVKSALSPKFSLDLNGQVNTKHLPLGSVIKMRTIRDAEAVKAMENTVRDVNIAFVNELAKISRVLQLDVVDVIDGMATKPFGKGPFYPGVGVGGHCIAVDPEWLRSASEKAGYVPDMIRLARGINGSMPDYVVGLLEDSLQDFGLSLSQINVAILGVSYKRNVADSRESPFFEVRKILCDKRATISVYDPWVTLENTELEFTDILTKADALIIVTDHAEIVRGLEEFDWSSSNVKVVIDGRNCLKPDFLPTTIAYMGVGRFS